MRKDARILSLWKRVAVLLFATFDYMCSLVCCTNVRGWVDVQGFIGMRKYKLPQGQIITQIHNGYKYPCAGVLVCCKRPKWREPEIVLYWMKGFLPLLNTLHHHFLFCSVLFNSLPFTAKMNLKLTHITVLIGLNDAPHYTLYDIPPHRTAPNSLKRVHSFVPSSRHTRKKGWALFFSFRPCVHTQTHEDI